MLIVNKNLSVKAVAQIDGIEIFHFSDLASIENDWRQFEIMAHSTVFQCFAWCKLWLDLCALHRNLRPMIVVGRDNNGEITFVLPFQLRKTFGITVLEWIGHGDFTYGGGIYSDALMDGSWFTQNGASVLATLHQAGVHNLHNMPGNIFGNANPIEFLHLSMAANPSFQTTLRSDFQSLYRQMRSARSINSIQRRDKRLEALGQLQFEHVTNLVDAEKALDEGLHHKAQQLRQAGIGAVFTQNDVQFYKAALKSHLHVYRLRLDGHTLSTILGTLYKGRFTLLIPSLATSAAQVHSPGDYLLRKSIALCCSDNIQVYDFGEGEQPYKLAWADRRIDLYNSISTKTFIGLPLALMLRLRQSFKRRIKTSPFMRENLYRARRIIFGKKS